MAEIAESNLVRVARKHEAAAARQKAALQAVEEYLRRSEFLALRKEQEASNAEYAESRSELRRWVAE